MTMEETAAGTVLGEEARWTTLRRSAETLLGAATRPLMFIDPEVIVDLLDALSAAREAGRAEGRNEERRRCGDLLSRQTDEAIAEYRSGGDPAVLFRALAGEWSGGRP